VTLAFKKATKKAAKARIALMGPSGSGKTVTALRMAAGMGKRVAVIDTEHASASKYAGEFGDFDALELESFSPETYVEAIRLAEKAGYDVVIIDSLSHAWSGKDGALEQVDKAAKKSSSGNSYTAWRDVTPQHNRLIDAIVGCKCHVIATMRTKTEYVLEEIQRGGKTIKQPKRVGLAAVQREGMEYEFDVVCDVTLDHDLCVTKTRCAALDGAVIRKAGEELGETLLAWLSDGVQPAAPKLAALPPSPDAEQPPEGEWGPRHERVWGLYANSSVVDQPLTSVPTEKLVAYIGRLEATVKGPASSKTPEAAANAKRASIDAVPYLNAARAELVERRKMEAEMAGANAETGELPDQEVGAPFLADPSDDPAGDHAS
jgi:hypothetical protein